MNAANGKTNEAAEPRLRDWIFGLNRSQLKTLKGWIDEALNQTEMQRLKRNTGIDLANMSQQEFDDFMSKQLEGTR